MPALRLERDTFAYNPVENSKRGVTKVQEKAKKQPDGDFEEVSLEWLLNEAKGIKYPTEEAERKAYRTSEGKAVSNHQWDVYDFTLSIPSGRVSTYKDVSQAVGGSARSVGNALRTNPFAPYIPCHRVIASSLFVGGFRGEWGHAHKTGTQCGEKLRYLAAEGVKFTDTGHLLEAEKTVWKGDAASDKEEDT